MANTFKFGNGNWAVKEEAALAYNDENNNFKPLPFSFDRASTATVVNKDGLIETVGVDEPRIDFLNNPKGHLLLEPSRQNKLTYSEGFNNWASVFTAVSLNEVVSPDGSVNATKLTDTFDSSTHRIQIGNTTSSSGSFCYSIFLKKGTLTTVALSVYSGANAADSKFDLDNGTIVSTTNGTAEIQEYGNDWYRCVVKGTLASTSTTVYIYLKEKASYSGSGQFLYAWGAQLEEGSYATSYIPTSGSAVTRSADYCYQDNLFTDIINASYPFTMYVEGTYNGQLSTLLSFLNKDASQQFFLIFIINNEVQFSARSNGTIEKIESGINLVEGQKYKIAATMESATSGKICVNGNSVTSKNNFLSQTQNSNINDLLVGQERIISDGGVRSSIGGAKLYNTALSDTELQALTTI